MPSSPKSLKPNYGLPARPTSGRRCHLQRRIFLLFSLVLVLSSGSLVILHSTKEKSSFCPSSYSSRQRIPACARPTRSTSQRHQQAHSPQQQPQQPPIPVQPGFQQHIKDQTPPRPILENNKDLNDVDDVPPYENPFANRDRPRLALPHLPNVNLPDIPPPPNPIAPPPTPSATPLTDQEQVLSDNDPQQQQPQTLPLPLNKEDQQRQEEEEEEEEEKEEDKDQAELNLHDHDQEDDEQTDQDQDQPDQEQSMDQNSDTNESIREETTEQSPIAQEQVEVLDQPAMAPEPIQYAPFEDSLDSNDNVKYVTYLPYAGITNQFYGMLRGMEVAKALDRTLILPPITASSHDKSKQNQPWSKFLDLNKFTELTGTKVVEFHQLRDVERTEYHEFECGITCGFGSAREIDFTAKGFLKQWKLNLTLKPLQTDSRKLTTIQSMLERRKDEKYLCISNTYKVGVKGNPEWERFGQHLHFTEELESFVRSFLDQNLVKAKPVLDVETRELTTPMPKYMIIHARRGDFIKYCESHFAGSRMVHCLPTTEQFAQRIDKVQARLNPKSDPAQILPVFVATNERRPEELKKFADLGWRYLDHDEMKTAESLGVFGPMMVDQVFMAYAEVLFGIQMSTFSRVGALRQRDWHGRKAEYL